MVFYGERSAWWVIITAEGPTGHGSRFIADTAVSKLMSVAEQALAYRKAQVGGWLTGYVVGRVSGPHVQA